ncbi:molybdate ABC transporter substrate-binding protein [Pontibacter sp. G13]|uniref:molybdate ABC transporter substrate-binding protein n=1 Tax=Pontibacter sp. G13 TaxID=3074898 RepID=UPI00288B0920|nr:molybdate ABC transporter substrate-binding protein [Pontibacter sp. G13]WNJ17180.1 molybdate ABC transporter substrate-binding protein [Pontibacter sp. G13]
MRLRNWGVCLWVFGMWMMGCEQSSIPTWAVAGSLYGPFSVLVDSFAAKSGHEIQLVTGSSGALTTQILQGAPIEVLISADSLYPIQLLEKRPDAQTGVWGYGGLAIWVRDTANDLSAYSLLNIRRIALANPEVAPFGRLAMQWIKAQESPAQITDKLVFSEHVGQLNPWIQQQSVDLAFTSRSIEASFQMEGLSMGKWIILGAPYDRIPHGFWANRSSEIWPEFQAFLHSTTGKMILTRYGYSTQALGETVDYAD